MSQRTGISLAKVVIFVLGVGTLFSCNNSSDNPSPTPVTPPGPASDQPNIGISSVPNQIRFTTGVPSDRQAALNESISLLFAPSVALHANAADVQSMMQLMKISDVTPSTLQKWLQDRVQFVVNSDFDMESSLSQSQRSFQYPQPGVLPPQLAKAAKQLPPKVPPKDNSQAQVAMLNIGAALYGYGKIENVLLDLNLPGIGQIPFTSPRVGLLEIGPGLFPDLGGHQVQNVLLDIFRAGVLFHEARHSDGNGESMGFLHSICPTGDYAGMAACDDALNGPYTEGALMIKNLMNSCTSCTAETMKILEVIYLDQADRVLLSDPNDTSTTATPGTDWQDAPEGQR